MLQIRPISDLRNRFTEISQTVHEKKEPIILTKNGYGDMVVMSYECFERYQNGQGPEGAPSEKSAGKGKAISAAAAKPAPTAKPASALPSPLPSDPPESPETPPERPGPQEIIVGFTD